MNFEQAMQHVISGGKVIRGKRKNSEDFFKIYLSSDKSISVTVKNVGETK
jgi:hypothetical protein